jgi:hypothetical protein
MTRKLTDAETVPIMLAAGLTPLIPYPGANEPWLCACDRCNKEVTPRYSDIRKGQGGCSVCGKGADLAIVSEVMARADLKPLESYPGNRYPWLCRHNKCGRVVTPRYDTIQQGGGGCPFCASYEYKSNKPGRVYLIRFDNHPDFPRGVIKVGAAGSKTRRLKQWQQLGWTLLEVFHFDDGEVPPKVERAVLKWLHDDLGLKSCLSAADLGGLRGYTETISVADLTQAGVSVDDVRKKVKRLVKKQSGQFTARVTTTSA